MVVFTDLLCERKEIKSQSFCPSAAFTRESWLDTTSKVNLKEDDGAIELRGFVYWR